MRNLYQEVGGHLPQISTKKSVALARPLSLNRGPDNCLELGSGASFLSRTAAEMRGGPWIAFGGGSKAADPSLLYARSLSAVRRYMMRRTIECLHCKLS